MSKLRLLHLEENPEDAEQVRLTLEHENVDCAIDHVSTESTFRQALEAGSYDLILSDYSVAGFDGLTALAEAKRLHPQVPFLLLSKAIGDERVAESFTKGAADYVRKDRLQRLSSTVLRAHHEANERRERHRSEEQIFQQAELLNHARDAIFVRNLNQEITYWNKGAERIYGWTAAEACGRKAGELLYRIGAAKRENIWEAVLEKGEWTGEIAQVTKTGKEVYVMSRRTLLRDSNNVPTAVLNINTDFTEKHRMETQMLRSQRMDTIGALAGGIAHDLNNVLAPILMVTEILQGSPLEPADLGMVDIARSSAQRGVALVKQLLQFTHGTKGEGTTKIKDVIDDLMNLMRKTFPRTLDFKSDVAPDVVHVLCDPTQLHQIVLNLCVNARDAMPKGGTLSIQVKNCRFEGRQMPGHDELISGSFVELTVSDTGMGIPPEIIGRIFEPFFTTKGEGKGTGLGLSMVATIVRNFQGFLDVSSIMGKGSLFRVYLPSGESLPQKSSVLEGIALSGKGRGILLVDDERVLLELNREILEAHGFEVTTAINGDDALTHFTAYPNKYAVVITDMLMPGLAGADLIAAIRDLSPRTLTICLSGSPDEAGHVSNRTGADAFLQKPCATKDLLGTLQNLLAAQNSIDSPTSAV